MSDKKENLSDLFKNIRFLNKDKLQAGICRESYPEFIKYFWDTIVADPLHWGWHMEELARELDTIANRVMKALPKEYDFVGNFPPGTSKSSLSSIFWPAHVWTKMPHAQFICTSYSLDLALDLSVKCRQVVNSDKYRKLFPEIQWSDEQNSKSMFKNTRGGWRYAVGAGGTITGLHGHFIVIDDPLNTKKAVSEIEIQTANRWIRETLSSRMVNRGVSTMILIMQRLHQNDPSALMLERRKVKHLCIPAVDEFPIFPAELKSKYVDGLMDPVRLPREVIDNIRQYEMGEYAFAGQYGQLPKPMSGNLFKTDRITKGMPINPIIKYVRAWDKAGTSQGGAYSVGVLMGMTKAKEFVVLDVKRFREDSAERERIIKRTAEEDGKGVIVALEQEPGSGGKESAQSTVRSLAGWRVRVELPRGDKVLRADTFSVQVNNGNAWMAPGHWNEVYLDELSYFPNSTYMDQVDASSLAFTILNEPDIYVGAIR